MKPILLLLLCHVTLFLCFSSCEKPCDKNGSLLLTNKSLNTVQKLTVEGVSYGTIKPGESKEISLAAGEYEFQQVGVNGGVGCRAAKATIAKCKITTFSCSY